MLVVTPLHYFHILFYPFVWLLNVSATGIVKMMGMKPADEGNEAFSQAEILSLSKNAVTTGDMEQNDVIYMQRAFELNDKTAKDIMVDRTSLFVIDITTTVKEALRDYLTQGYSRFPVVANGDKDKILGYVYIYDLVKQGQVDPSVKVSKLLRSIINVPEVTPIHSILAQMIKKQTPIVVVVDEYGGTVGLSPTRIFTKNYLVPSRMKLMMSLMNTFGKRMIQRSSESVAKQPCGILNVTSTPILKPSLIQKSSPLLALSWKIIPI